jgi:hypothetical protein
MTDILLPLNLRQAQTSIRYIDSVGISRGLYTGALKTAIRGGDRLGASIRFTSHGGNPAEERSNRAILRSFLAFLRGRANRAFLTDTSYRRRGSMPAVELLPGGSTFANGTTGLTPTACSISVSDRVLTMKASGGYVGTVPSATAAAISVTQYAPYVVRQMTIQGRGDLGDAGPFASDGTITANGYADYGLRSAVIVPAATTVSPAVVGGIATSGYIADDYVQVPYWSFARCALVDNGANALLHSDEINDAVWTKTNVTIGTDAGTAPDGTTTADSLLETSATGDHAVSQSITVSTGVFDVCFASAVHGSTRGFCAVNVTVTGGSVQVYVNLTTGAISTAVAASGNFTNARAFVSPMGNGWFYICVIARKTGSETTATAKVYAANVTGASSYTGSAGVTAIYVWRATLCGSSVPSRLRQTVATTVPTDGNQTGSSLYTKGWPVSTAGALLIDDQFEVLTSRGSELKILTAPVNTDAAGLAYLQFAPPLLGTPVDGAPIIMHQPFGRFVYTGESVGWDNDPGFFTSASCDFEEACGL